MKLTVQVVVDPEDGSAPVVQDVAALQRTELGMATVGLRLSEARHLLAAVQEVMLIAQASVALAGGRCCPACGQDRHRKDCRSITMRTLFGTLPLVSPRYRRCRCTAVGPATFSPLAAMLPERTTPELRYLEGKFAALASFDHAAALLAEVFPLGRRLHATSVRRHARAIAERLEGELGDERFCFIDTCPRDWEELPRPDLPITVGLDGGYVHSAAQTSRKDGWFEVVAGRSIPAEGKAKTFASVVGCDHKPKRRLFELLRAQGLADNQQITFLTDGGEDVSDLPLYLNPQAEHLLDWFHVTMRLTVLGQLAKGLPTPEPDDGMPVLADPLAVRVGTDLIRIKWLLWHGNTFRALQELSWILGEVDLDDVPPVQQKFVKALTEFHGYIDGNTHRIPNYGERYRADEAISSAAAESAVNQVISHRMVKKQQMRWSPAGAHLLLQVRTRVLDDDLAADFHRWYPGLTDEQTQPDPLALAA